MQVFKLSLLINARVIVLFVKKHEVIYNIYKIDNKTYNIILPQNE